LKLNLSLSLRDQEESKSITVDLISPDPKDYLAAIGKCGAKALARLQSGEWDQRAADALVWVQVNKVEEMTFEEFEAAVDWSDLDLDDIDDDLASLSSYPERG
jgi:hypothetical protein